MNEIKGKTHKLRVLCTEYSAEMNPHQFMKGGN